MSSEKYLTQLNITKSFNEQFQYTARQTDLKVGNKNSIHEFDLYDAGKVIGGITTSPWKNKTGSNNTGGQDRASTELLWLSLWEGQERRVIILTDLEMAQKLYDRWNGCLFQNPIEIIYYSQNKFKLIGQLG